MPVFKVRAPDGTVIKVEAADQATAIRGAQEHFASRQGAAPRSTAPKGLVDNVTGFMANLNRGLGVGDEMAGGTDAILGMIQGRYPVHSLSDVGGAFRQGMINQRTTEDNYNQAHPLKAALARGTGNAVTVAVPGGGATRAVTLAPRLVNMARGAVTAGAVGAAYGAVDRGTPGERLKAASDAAHNPVVLGLGAAAGAAAPALRRTSRLVGQPTPQAQALRTAGVRGLTPGQARGGLMKATEDQATHLPILGPAIQAARQRGLQEYGAVVGNRALKPIGQKVPDGLTGQDMVAHVKGALSESYDKALPSGQIVIDQDLRDALASHADDIASMTPAGRARLDNILNQRLLSRQSIEQTGSTLPMNPGDPDLRPRYLTGEDFQKARSGLKYEARNHTSSNDPDLQTVGKVLNSVTDALDGAASRQDESFGRVLRNTNAGYAEYVRLRDASQRAANTEGVFAPSQYMSAVKAADASAGRGQSATGQALGQDLASAGQAVLPSKVGDSGTAGRNMVGMITAAPGAAGGAMLAGAPGAALGSVAAPAATLGLLNLASKAYTPEAISAFNAALDRNSPQSVAALNSLRQAALNSPAMAQLYAEAQRRLSLTAGAAAMPTGPQRPSLATSPQ